MQRAPGRLSTWLRRLALGLCFAAAVGWVLAMGFAWLRDARLGRPTLVFNYSRMMSKRLPELARANAQAVTIGFLGDSSVVSYPDGRTVPEALQHALDRQLAGRPRVRVESLGMSGSGPFDYYFLADEIAAASPRLLVVALNFDHFSDAWRGAYSRPQLAGLIEPARLPEALGLPLHWAGLSTDALLFYVAVVKSGGYEPWYWLTLRQTQVGRARERLERWLAGRPARLPGAEKLPETPEELFADAIRKQTLQRVFTSDDIYRYRRDSLLEHYGAALGGLDPENPALLALCGALRRFREAGIQTLVYVVPADHEYMDEQGVYDPAGVTRTIALLADRVSANGAELLDLHKIFPTETFRDAPGHLTHDKDIDGPELLAEELARPLLRWLRAASARDKGSAR